MHPSYKELSIDELMNEDLWDLDDSEVFLDGFTIEEEIAEEYEDDQLPPSKPKPLDEPFDWFHDMGKEYDV
jgi:hypothetical protein